MIDRLNALGLRLGLMLKCALPSRLAREEGQTMAEYALILALIAAVVAAVVTVLQVKISSIFTEIGAQI